MASQNDGSGSDPFDRMTEPAPPAESAGYLIETLASMAHFAHVSNLHNSSVMLAAASQVIDQECRLLTSGPPEFHADMPENWPDLFPARPGS